MIKYNHQLNCSCIVEAGACPNGERFRSGCTTKEKRSAYARAVANGMDLVEARQFLPHVMESVKREEKRLQWTQLSSFLSFVGTKQYNPSPVPVDIQKEERLTFVSSKKGTKDDLARIAEIKLMDSILSDHTTALKRKEELDLFYRGIQWLICPVSNVVSSHKYKISATGQVQFG